MNIIRTAIPDVLILEPKVFGDARGFFMESWNQKVFDEAVGHPVRFVQDNHSRSSRGVLRGLHYQLPPHAQGKLVRVVSGSVFDVAVDLRRGSPTFGQWAGVELTGENRRASRTASSSPARRPTSSTRPPTCTRRSARARCAGTTRRSASPGRTWAWRRCCRPRMRWRRCWPTRGISTDAGLPGVVRVSLYNLIELPGTRPILSDQFRTDPFR